MKNEPYVVMGFKIVLILLIVIAGFGQATLQLWNIVVPKVFGLPELTFWQAVGLMLLSWILFGGLRGFGFMGGARRCRCYRDADAMTSEQKERLRSALRPCHGPSRAPEPRADGQGT